MNEFIEVQKFKADEWFNVVKDQQKNIIIYILDRKTKFEKNYLIASLIYYKNLIQDSNEYYLYDLNYSNISIEKERFLNMLNLPYNKEILFYNSVDFFENDLNREKWLNKKRKKEKYKESDFLIKFSDFNQLMLYFILFWRDGYKIVCTFKNELSISLKDMRKYFELEKMDNLINVNITSMIYSMPDWNNIVIYLNSI